MVRFALCIQLFILLLKPAVSFAAKFEATVDKIHLFWQEPIMLKLLLYNASPEGELDLSELSTNFQINGKQQFNNYTLVNGQSMHEKGWKICLLPKAPGEHNIPIIELHTNKGILATKPIRIHVNTASKLDIPIRIDAKFSKKVLYVQEPVFLTITITREVEISNAQLVKWELPDSLVEEIGKTRNYEAIVAGKNVNISELQYLITPLKPGLLKLPGIILQGEMKINSGNKNAFWDPFSGKMGFLDPFKQLQNYEPFMIQSESPTIEVNPALFQPWLPLYSLQIEESWCGLETAKIDEPLSRTIILKAIGTTGQQLPKLESYVKTTNIKIYSDNPKVDFEFNAKNNELIGTRQETFSIIPLKSGELQIPEIKIAWWNLTSNKQSITHLPSKIIQILPSTMVINENISFSEENFSQLNKISFSSAVFSDKRIQWLIIAILVLLLITLGMFIFMWKMKRKLQQLSMIPVKASLNNFSDNKLKSANIKKVKNKTLYLQTVSSLKALKNLMITYAENNWQFPKHNTLKSIPSFLEKVNYQFDKSMANQLFESLDQALYARSNISLDELKILWLQFIHHVKKPKKTRKKLGSKSRHLNPT